MKKMLLLLSIILLAGCSHFVWGHATWVKRTYKPKKSGIVKYPAKASSWAREDSIKDAKSKMTNFCGGAYSITEESYTTVTTPHTRATSTGSGTVHLEGGGTVSYMNLHFDCD